MISCRLELEEAAKEILAHAKGRKVLRVRRIVLPADVNVKRIRPQARMSQAEFAGAFCINPRTLQEWEQGRRKPDATTRLPRRNRQKSQGCAKNPSVLSARKQAVAP